MYTFNLKPVYLQFKNKHMNKCLIKQNLETLLLFHFKLLVINIQLKCFLFNIKTIELDVILIYINIE